MIFMEGYLDVRDGTASVNVDVEGRRPAFGRSGRPSRWLTAADELVEEGSG
jgi:hypothetical protein